MTPRRKRARKYIPLPERLAAALSLLLTREERDDLRARKVPAKLVIGRFDFDHNVLHALGGDDRWWNLTPMLRAPHRVKAAKDTSIVAKVDRLSARHEEMRRMLLIVDRPPPPPKPKRYRPIPSRPFPKRGKP